MEDKVFERHTRLRSFPPAQLAYIVYRRLREQGLHTTLRWVQDKLVRRFQGTSPRESCEVAPRLHVGGQHTRRGLQRMRREGIGAVVNMREEADDAERDVLLDDYLWLPTTDDAPPTLEDLERGAAFIEEQIAEGRGVYVHCASGVGRAPTMAAAYLVSQGVEPEEAWARIRKTRPFVRPAPKQIEVVEEFARRRSAQEQEVEEQQEEQEGEMEELKVRAMERITSDPALTDPLTDEEAHPLIRWAEAQITRLVEQLEGGDEQEAWERLEPRLQELRRRMREIARRSAEAEEPLSEIERRLDSYNIASTEDEDDEEAL
ncbi:MAG: dual specificity protein phosphatase family protein [Anaerolineales bacterium]